MLDRVIRSLERIPPRAVDALLGAWIFGDGTYQLVQYQAYYAASKRPFALTLLAIGAVGVALRRVHLWLAVGLVAGATVIGLVVQASVYPDSNGALLSQLVLLYTIAERFALGPSVVALVAELVVIYLARRTDNVNLLWLIQAEYSYIALAWFAGRAQARRRRIGAELDRTVAALRDERERLMRIALTRERARLAGDLHALVVRGVERMNAATIRARARLATSEVSIPETIGVIESAGRQTLAAMRKLLAVLRRREEGLVEADRTFGLPQGPSPGSALLERGLSNPWRTDALVVALMAILAVAEPFMLPWRYNSRLYVPLATIVVAALLFRRRFPLAVLLLVAAVAFGWNTFSTGTAYTADRAMVVAVYSVAVFRDGWATVAALVAQIVAYAPLDRIPNNCDVPCQLTWTTQFLFAVVAAHAVREGRRLNATLEEQAEMLQRTRLERVRRAVHDERARVARDVHDLVAHGVTLMVIQAGAARWLAASDRPRADDALRSVERSGREALLELASLVDSLGIGPSDVGSHVPVADQLTVHALVDQATRGGMVIELTVDGSPRMLDSGLELALYRIVQEALTNVRKHAAGARTRVSVRYGPQWVDVEVTNAAPMSPARDAMSETMPGVGYGLVGIAERAELFGGTAEAGHTPDMGYRVRASLGVENGSASDRTVLAMNPPNRHPIMWAAESFE